MDVWRIIRAIGVVVVLCSGCAGLHTPPADARVDFAVHPGYSGLVVDRMDGGQSAVLVRPRSTGSAAPTDVLEADGKPLAALWVTGDDVVAVRPTTDPSAPLLGEVVASSTEGATRFAFYLADGASYHSSAFERIDSANSPNLLGKQMLHWLQVPGVYRAELYDAQGAPRGWLRVEILPYQGFPRHFDGDIPEPLNGPLAIGAVALLNSEIDSIEVNAFPDDY
jgi:hypothetical protein